MLNARCRHLRDIQKTASCTRFVLPILQHSVLCRCKARIRLLPLLLSVVSMVQCACGLFQQATLVSRLRTQSGTRRPVPLTHGSSLLPTAHGLNNSLKHRRHQAFAVQAAATAEVGKLIAKTEIPAFIPRQDLMDQLTRWAYTDIQEEGMRKFGLPCKVTGSQW